MADTEQEKTEDATEHRVQQFREEGKVASSKELASAVILTVGGGTLIGTMGMFSEGFRHLQDAMHARISDGTLTMEDCHSIATTIGLTVGPPLLIVLAAVTGSSMLAGVLITNFNLSTDALALKFERLDPLQNAKSQFFSIQPWMQLLKGSVVAFAVGWAAWACIRDHLDALPVIANLDMRAQSAFLGELFRDFLSRVIPVSLAVGAADFGWQKYQLSEQMKMTKEEIKEENKEFEGDPKMKAKRRQRQRQISMGQMLHKVKEADVVVVNPTHYAVALRYRKEEGAAPRVLARGVDHLALKIRAEATKHEVAIIENRALARALYAKSKLGLPIPAEFYGPVAQLLAAVYKQRMATRGGGGARR